MDRQELIDTIAEDLFSYAMAGHIDVDAVANGLKPQGLADRYVDYELLVRLHFILLPAVIDFVDQLPDRLRHIKTESAHTQLDAHGEIRGRINWPATLAQRSQTAPGDRSRFVIDERTRTYDIPENLVLKRVLLLIADTLDAHAEWQRYGWFSDRWGPHGDTVRMLDRIMRQNVHVRRIRSPTRREPTPRMVAAAASSRQPIYRDAATLLRTYQDALAGDPAVVRQLLRLTMITPDDDDRLFELYVAFQLIRGVDRVTDATPAVRGRLAHQQALARIALDATTAVEVYHDSAAGERGLAFLADVFEKDRDALSRTELVLKTARSVEAAYYDEHPQTIRTGRPDVIILKLIQESRTDYLITEVKFSASRDRVRQGIRELLEYLTFMRDGDVFVHDPPDIFGPPHRGLLVIDDLDDRHSPPVPEQEHVTIVQAGELEVYIEEILQYILDGPAPSVAEVGGA